MFRAFIRPAEGRFSIYLMPKPVLAMRATPKYFAEKPQCTIGWGALYFITHPLHITYLVSPAVEELLHSVLELRSPRQVVRNGRRRRRSRVRLGLSDGYCGGGGAVVESKHFLPLCCKREKKESEGPSYIKFTLQGGSWKRRLGKGGCVNL